MKWWLNLKLIIGKVTIPEFTIYVFLRSFSIEFKPLEIH